MTTKRSRKLFVNIPVRDLQRSIAFFSKLGFEFDPRFTDDKATCMIVSEEAYFMLLSEPFFQTFITKQVCDTRTHVESLFALSCESRAEVDEIVQKAIAAGGAAALPPKDHGFMYQSSFFDVDGHHWEVLWMDPATLE